MNAFYLYTKFLINLLQDRQADDILLIRPQHAREIRIILQDIISRHPLQITINIGWYKATSPQAVIASVFFLALSLKLAQASMHGSKVGVMTVYRMSRTQ